MRRALAPLALLLFAWLPVAAGAGTGELWHSEEYEYNFVEMMVLMVLVVLALAFETAWHHTAHLAEHSYCYGQLDGIVGHMGSHGPSSAYGTVGHVQLFRELVSRAGGEFMTLGFLACVVYFCRQAGGFAFLARCSERSVWALPSIEEDWLHTAENVHMQLFFAMVFYFVLIARIAVGSSRRIRSLEQCRLIRCRQEGGAAPQIVVDEEELKEHAQLRRYFIGRMVHLQQESPSLFEGLTEALGMDPDEDDFVPDFMRFVNKELAFSSYVSINIEQGVVDSVQVHKTTWSFLLMLLGTIAMLNRFARMPLVQIIPVLGFLAVSCTIAMHVAIRYTRQKVSKLARDEPAAARGEAMEPSSASPAARFVRTLQGRNPASLCMLRTLQITLLLISYLLSRVLLDVHDWAVTAKASLIYTSGFAGVFAVLALALPRSVPEFLIAASLPPHFDQRSFRIFCSLLLQSREAMYQKELVALKARLLRGGTSDISPEVSDAKGHLQRAVRRRSSQTSKGGSSVSVASARTRLSQSRLQQETMDIFRSCVSAGRDRGLDEAELMAGLAAHLGAFVGGWSSSRMPPRLSCGAQAGALADAGIASRGGLSPLAESAEQTAGEVLLDAPRLAKSQEERGADDKAVGSMPAAPPTSTKIAL